jgi:hypothetical protein
LLGSKDAWGARKRPALVTDRFTCFEVDLEKALRSEIGSAVYGLLLTACQKQFGILRKKHAQKDPSAIARIIE